MRPGRDEAALVGQELPSSTRLRVLFFIGYFMFPSGQQEVDIQEAVGDGTQRGVYGVDDLPQLLLGQGLDVHLGPHLLQQHGAAALLPVPATAAPQQPMNNNGPLVNSTVCYSQNHSLTSMR